jgi:dynein heavy chain 1
VQAREQNRNPQIEDLGDMAADAVLLNSVQKGLNDWKRAILSVTRLDRDVSSGDAMTEINFWLSMDAALNRIQAQLKSPEIGLFSPL